MNISGIHWIAPSARIQLGKTRAGTVDVAAALCAGLAGDSRVPEPWGSLCAGLVPAWQGTAGSLSHAGSLTYHPRQEGWEVQAAQPPRHYVTWSCTHWLLVPGGQDAAASSINPFLNIPSAT